MSMTNRVCRLPSSPRRSRPRRFLRVLVLTGAMLGGGVAAAEAIYKSVDAEGRVSYSTMPLPEGSARSVEAMPIRTGPQVEPPGAAGETPAAMPPPGPATDPSAGKRVSPAGKAGAGQSASEVRELQQAIIKAKAELEQAKIHGAEDWQTMPSGDQVSTFEYDQRVTAAQQKVRALEAALARARKP